MREVRSRLAQAVVNTSPGVDVEEAAERIDYALGAMLHALARPTLATGESPDRDAEQRRMQRLIRFLAAGLAVAADSTFRAPNTRLST